MVSRRSNNDDLIQAVIIYILTFRLPVDPLLELERGDLPLGGVRLQVGLQALANHAGGDVRVPDVAKGERKQLIPNSAKVCRQFR